MLVGLFFFFIIGCEFFINYKISFKKKHHEAASAVPPQAPAQEQGAQEEAPALDESASEALAVDESASEEAEQ